MRIGSLQLGDDGNAAVGKIVLVEIMSPDILQGSKVSKPFIHSLVSSSSSSHLLPMLSADSIIPCDRRQISSVPLDLVDRSQSRLQSWQSVATS
jgi:hypothetical protein